MADDKGQQEADRDVALLTDFVGDEDFHPDVPEDEKEGLPEEDSSTSTDDTAEGAGAGKDPGAQVDGSDGEPSGEKKSAEGDGGADAEKGAQAEGDEQKPSVPYDRFSEVIRERNELRDKMNEISGRLSGIEDAKKEETAAKEKEPEGEAEDLDEPFMGTNRDFQEAVRKEAKQVLDAEKGSGDDNLQQVRNQMSKMSLRISERDAREAHSDYDKVVYDSGFFANLLSESEKGNEDFKKSMQEILSSDNPAGDLYEFARDVQGLTPPPVDKIDPENWEQVQPVLKRLGLKTTEEKWQNRRKKSSGQKTEKKSSAKKASKEEQEPSGDQTLRGAPSGAEPQGDTDDGEIDLEKEFPL